MAVGSLPAFTLTGLSRDFHSKQLLSDCGFLNNIHAALDEKCINCIEFVGVFELCAFVFSVTELCRI